MCDLCQQLSVYSTLYIGHICVTYVNKGSSELLLAGRLGSVKLNDARVHSLCMGITQCRGCCLRVTARRYLYTTRRPRQLRTVVLCTW